MNWLWLPPALLMDSSTISLMTCFMIYPFVVIGVWLLDGFDGLRQK